MPFFPDLNEQVTSMRYIDAFDCLKRVDEQIQQNPSYEKIKEFGKEHQFPFEALIEYNGGDDSTWDVKRKNISDSIAKLNSEKEKHSHIMMFLSLIKFSILNLFFVILGLVISPPETTIGKSLNYPILILWFFLSMLSLFYAPGNIQHIRRRATLASGDDRVYRLSGYYYLLSFGFILITVLTIVLIALDQKKNGCLIASAVLSCIGILGMIYSLFKISQQKPIALDADVKTAVNFICKDNLDESNDIVIQQTSH